MKESDFKKLWKDNKKYEHIPLPESVFMTDEQLKTMTKDEANKTLSYEDNKQEQNTRQLWDEYTIELTDCDNGIFLKVHDTNPDANDAFLVYKHEEQEQMLGKFLLDSIRAKMNCNLCSKARMDIKITTIED